MTRNQMDPLLKCTFSQVYNTLKRLPGETVEGLRTTGKGIKKGIKFSATADVTLDGREFINLPHNNRIYEGDWGYTTNSMGKDGQRIGQYARPLDDWCDNL